VALAAPAPSAGRRGARCRRVRRGDLGPDVRGRRREFHRERPGPAFQTTDVRGLLEQLHAAVRQVVRSGSESQLTAAAGIISDARRALYRLLAD
jgi:hypothetical protein